MPNATGIITNAEMSTSTRVFTTLSPIWPATGCWLAIEVPKSPVSKLPSQWK